jgi:glycosyltransferase involved in cell wall biosynthesis
MSELVGQVSVIRTWLYATPNEGVVRKTLGHLSFMASSVLLGTSGVGRPDVVVVSSPTFFSIGSAWAIARIKRARLVVEVRDLWPAIFVDLGVLTNPFLISLLEGLELAAYRAADAVVVVTEGFKDQIAARGIPAEKITTIPNGADLTRFSPRPPDESTRQRLGARPGETLVVYIGAHGVSQGLITVVEAAEKLAGSPVHVALVGEGADKSRVVEAARLKNLTNLTMLPSVPRDEVIDIIAAADICLVPLRDIPLFSTFIPSKMFEYMSMGKAIVGGVRGEAASILLAAGAVVVDPEDSAQLASAIQELSVDPDRRRRMGDSAREFVREFFDRRVLADRYLRLLQKVVTKP